MKKQKELFKVTVILPVFNAELYVEQAINSAITINSVKEIIIIEDGSSDDSHEMCRQLTKNHSKIKLLRHPSGRNRGPGASRNLGIRNASCPYISFLDADDIYLPNRFDLDKEQFLKNPEVDGVYNAVGAIFENDSERNKFYDHFKYSSFSTDEEFLTTVKPGLYPPDQFLTYYLTRNIGKIHTNGITLRKSVFEKAGFFDEDLWLHQDAHMWIRILYHGILLPGETRKPVALRRVHEANRILSKRNKKFRGLYWRKIFCFFSDKKIDKQLRFFVLRQTIRNRYPLYKNHSFSLLKHLVYLYSLISLIIFNPKIFLRNLIAFLH